MIRYNKSLDQFEKAFDVGDRVTIARGPSKGKTGKVVYIPKDKEGYVDFSKRVVRIDGGPEETIPVEWLNPKR